MAILSRPPCANKRSRYTPYIATANKNKTHKSSEQRQFPLPKGQGYDIADIHILPCVTENYIDTCMCLLVGVSVFISVKYHHPEYTSNAVTDV